MKLDSEFKRLSRTETITKLATAMGVARAQADSGRALFHVFNSYIERVAEQYARAFALRLYHGATTASNFEVNGRYLDYGTETAQPAHGKVYVLEHIEPAGETAEIVRDLITEFAEELNERTISFWSQAEIESFAIHFRHTYDLRYREEFFALLGWRQELLTELKSTEEARELGGLLGELATKGSKPYLGRFVDPHAKITTYDFATFASHLVAGELSRESARAIVIEKLGLTADEPLVSRIEEIYSKVLQEAQRLSSAKSISADRLHRFMGESVKMRNAPAPALYRWNLIPASELAIEKYMKTGSASDFQEAIDSSIHSSLRLLPDSVIWERVALRSARNRTLGAVCSALF
jgi:hypothetical protein